MLNFSEINFYLLKNNPFYFGMLQQSKIKLDNESKYLACVEIKHKIEITLNPVRLSALSIGEQAAIIIHEFQHIFSGHIRQALQKRPEAFSAEAGVQHNPILANIAMDCEINARNAELKNSPNLGIKSKSEMRGIFAEDFKLKDGDSWAYNFKKLLNESDPKESSHDHDYFQGSDTNVEFSDHVVEIAAKKAKESTKGMQAGNIPKEVEEFLDDVEKSKSLPWNLLLRQFMQSLVSIKQTSSWKKRNRRFKGKLPGIKKDPKVKIMIGMDESGSVGNEEHAKFVNEIKAIHSTGIVEIWIAKFDTQIHEYYKYDGGDIGRCAEGGTDFIPVHEKCLEESFKGLIMLTDGQAWYPDAKEVTYKSLWVMSTDEKAPYGQTVHIK